MAGIGFALRNLLRVDTYSHYCRAYVYAGVLSTGPWLISVFGLVLIYLITLISPSMQLALKQFQASVTYLIALSLILSSFGQYAFARYVSDREFEHRTQNIAGNYIGMLVYCVFMAGLLGVAFMSLWFQAEPLWYRVMMVGSFVVLCAIWPGIVLLSGLKKYHAILWIFLMGYGVSILACYFLRQFALTGLMIGFFIGQSLLLMGIIFVIFSAYPTKKLIQFDFVRPGRMYRVLGWASLFYNVAFWIDKFIFWGYPATSNSVIGPLRASLLYDMPMFLAILTIIPGMAVLLFTVETDFAEHYGQYFAAVREGGTLFEIRRNQGQLIESARHAVLEVLKIQGLVLIVLFLVGSNVIQWLHIPAIYLYLFRVDSIAAALLVVYIALLNMLFYLDKRRLTLWLNLVFFLTNMVLTILTLKMGVFFYGYGFAASLFLVVLLAMFALNQAFDRLEYATFMPH